MADMKATGKKGFDCEDDYEGEDGDEYDYDYDYEEEEEGLWRTNENAIT